MSDQPAHDEEKHSPADDPDLTPLPEAIESTHSGISKIWIVPIIAVIIGLGLIYTSIKNRGPTITVSFKSANGIEVKKTKVKYKNITIGQVKAVSLTEDLQHVLVTLRLQKRGGDLISSHSRFWIERPRLQGMSITGLDTLFSGAYIAIDPGPKGEEVEHYVGLENPPPIKGGENGKIFKLEAQALGSLDYGSPVYYRGIEVGQIVGYQLQPSGKMVDIDVFVHEPFDEFVKQTSKFWLVSGVELDLDSDGVHVFTQSVASVIMGGVAFIDLSTTPSSPAEQGDRFQLYDTKAMAEEEHFDDVEVYVLRFTESARGLSVGAPVEFKGFELGRVKEIGLEFDWQTKQVYVPVKIEVEGGRLARVARGLSETRGGPQMQALIEHGLRAQLQTGNLVTGQLFIALDFFEDVHPAQVELTADGQQLIPTTTSPLSQIMEQLTATLSRLQSVPVEDIGAQVSAALRSIRRAGNQLKIVLQSGEINATLVHASQVAKETTGALQRLQKLVDQDSQVFVELRRVLRDVGGAARSIRQLADQLEREPDSLLRGRD